MTALVTSEVLVQVARGLRFDGRALTLVDLAPSTIRVTTTPLPEVGHVCTGTVLDRWAAEVTASPGGTWRVHGTLALLDAEAQVWGDAAFVVSNPRVTSAGLAYDAEVMRGAVPSESGACVLYLDWGAARGVT
jgi:hypothetical protein